jgi:hypothetical protein
VEVGAMSDADADEPLDEWHIRELIDEQLNPTIVYETTDGKRDAVRDLAETLETEDSG